MHSMLGDKQQQTTESGSTALQAGRDINIHGPSVSEVRELCIVFLRDNFPQLREEAKRTAEEHVRAFATTLESRLINDAASIMLEKFREPDVQAAINDAVQASARKGSRANPQLLTTLISERVARQTNDYKDMVLSEAVQVVPRLTGQQIALISFVHAARSIVIQGLPGVAELESFGQTAIRFSSAGFGLSESQKQHLQYAGAASVNNILGGDIFDSQSQEYKYFGIGGGPAFKDALAKSAPSYLRLLEQFATDNLFAINLTSVGQAIALANISNYIGKLDYTVWLK
jgi:hypothetical protein